MYLTKIVHNWKIKNRKKIFPGIPDPDFYPDSTFSGFFEFFESVAYMNPFCQRIFELYQMVDLWRGMYFITSPVCHARRTSVRESFMQLASQRQHGFFLNLILITSKYNFRQLDISKFCFWFIYVYFISAWVGRSGYKNTTHKFYFYWILRTVLQTC